MEYLEFIKTKTKFYDENLIELGDFELNKNLFDYQKEIVKWSLKKGKSAIFADCGLGKTIMQLSWGEVIVKATNKPVLLLAPLAVGEQTNREAKNFGIESEILTDIGDLKEPKIYITNYEKLHKFLEVDFGGIILDESSILKSFQGKFRNMIIDHFDKIKFKLACTATPSPNDYTELGNHSEFLNICTMSEMLSMFFINDVEDKNGTGTGGWRLKGHAETKFWEFVGSWAVMLKNPKDLGFSGEKFVLPKMNLQNFIINTENNGDALFVNPANTMSERREARKGTINNRIEKVLEIIKQNPYEQFIIWCDFNMEGDTLEDLIEGSVQVSGSTDDDKKKDYMIGFSEGKYKYLITKPRIAGFGMNWQNCNNMIFCGISDSYEQFYQATRRCYRFGQKKEVNVSIVISDRETTVLENVKRKENEFEKMSTEMVKNALKSFNFNNNFKMEYKENMEKGNNYTAYLGDSCEILKKLDDESVGYSVFSPPFASLYTYSNSERDLGNCKNTSEFYEHFIFIVKEIYRVLQSGRLVSFHCMNLPTSKFRDGFIGISDFRGDLIRIFQEVGFIYHSEVCVWKDPVVAMQRTKAVGLLHKTIKKDSSMSRQGIPDYIVTMRKPGENKNPISHTADDFPVDFWQKIASPIWMDINQSDTLQKDSAREEKDEKHICPLQLDVIRRCLFLWSNPGDVVLSPFMGIGSEGYVSLETGRKFVGCELKESYYKQAIGNLKNAEGLKKQKTLFDIM